MNHLHRYLVDYKGNRRMDSKKNPRKPRLERRNAGKNIDYDASLSSSSNSSYDMSGSSALITRSLDLPDRTSFRVEGIEGEFDIICRRLGLSVEDFMIPTVAWEARNIRSSSDLLPRSTLYELGSPKTEEVEVEEKDSEVAGRVLDSTLVVLNEGNDVLAELGNRFGNIVGARDVMELIRNEPRQLNACSTTAGTGGGIKGVRPPVLKPPPSVALKVIDNAGSTWDILRDFAPEGDKGYSSTYHEDVSSSDEENDEEVVEEVQREEEMEVRPGETNRLSASCSFTTSNDDDCSSTTTEPTSNISPNGRFKRNITYWERGELLGRGSFGSVYEGIAEDGFFFAVKEVSLLDQGSQGKQSVFQLEQEIALLSQFEHENIVQYYGTDKDESKLYIFLELVTKGSLQSLYAKYHLRDSQVSAYTRQILHGLKYLHDRNVIHRDIKCANILVDASGSVKLADFGLAKATRLNDIKSCKGTAFWMAPEVVKNQKNQGYGLPADIWSLGCTVLEMLTGQIPYSYLEHQMQALYRIGKGVPPDVPETLSKDAQAFIKQCLKVDPNDRPTPAQLLEHPFVKRSLSTSSGSASPHLGRRH